MNESTMDRDVKILNVVGLVGRLIVSSTKLSTTLVLTLCGAPATPIGGPSQLAFVMSQVYLDGSGSGGASTKKGRNTVKGKSIFSRWRKLASEGANI